MIDDLFAALAPAVDTAGLELVDVELRSGVLLVTVDAADGVDLEALTTANRVVSALLDELDPIPGRYTLEVSSPGVERTLRRPDHFRKAVGETVTVKTRPQVPGDRRLRGTLVAADDDGLELQVEGEAGERRRLAYRDIDKARTVFQWGPAPRPGRGGSEPKPSEPVPSPGQNQTKKTNQADRTKRKQVVSP